LTAREAKKQAEMVQKHTNYEVLMTAEELVGVIDLDHPTRILNPNTQKSIVSYTSCYVLLNFLKMRWLLRDCGGTSGWNIQTNHIIIPNTPEAEQLVGMMNKNLPAFLFHILQEQGLPNNFIDSLLRNSCEATMLANMSRCTWDPVN
jgi:hypothetical protein